MAPPPPSKSYLWKFEDDSSTASSSTDSSPSRDDSIDYLQSEEANRFDRSHSPFSFSPATREEEEEHVSKSQPKSKRKNKKKKNKKKSKPSAASTTLPTTEENPPCLEKRVAFDQVTIREFRRSLGEGVPVDGGWPLGLEMEACFSQSLKIEDYEDAKAEKLQRRWQSCYPECANAIPKTLETRPYDYKRGAKNLLFRPLSEHSRMKMLLESGDHEVQHSSHPSSSGPAQKQRRTRSKSVTDEYSDDFPHVKVLHIRNELEQLRASRSMEGHTGCTCRKLHVYIVPPGGGGKKAHSRRLSVHKVIEELRKRHQLPSENKTREELELLLQSIVAEEPCCTQDCPCSQNGINCQADACSCWLASHMDDKKAVNHALNSEEIRKRCGNKYGMYSVDASKVDAERKEQIMMYCQVLGGEPGM